jgi:hypothetical protein
MLVRAILYVQHKIIERFQISKISSMVE